MLRQSVALHLVQENALEKKTAQVSELRKSETHQELSAAQLKRLKEQEDEIALLKRQLNAREQGQDEGSSHNHRPASNSAAGPSKSAHARHHIIDLPPAQAPAARSPTPLAPYVGFPALTLPWMSQQHTSIQRSHTFQSNAV